MIRIEAVVQTDKTSLVVDAIKKAGAKGLTVFPGRGQGRGERPMVESSRGTTRHVAEYNEVDSIVTIVDESETDVVIAAIVNAAGTGSKGDGKIFVSKVDEVIDIGSKQKGSLAL